MEIDAPMEVQNGIIECESRHRKKRSVAWEHFEKLPALNKEVGKAKCKHCDMVLTATPRSGTSHLRRHVERCQKRLVLDIKPISMEAGFCQLEYCNDIRRSISKVWYEFEKFRTENYNEQKAQCKHCKMILSAAAKNGTSHLKRHLDKCPKRVTSAGDVRRYLPTTATEKVAEGSSLVQIYQLNTNELHRNISRCIIEGAHPFSLVEERGFRCMMSKACPYFKPFSQSIVRRELFSMYLEERDNVKEMLTKALGRVCLTTNYWKGRDTKDEYICIAAQFIDSHWKLHRRILCCRALVPPYDGISVADDVACLLSNWSIEHKIFSITLDDTSYNESMVSSLESSLYTKKVLLSEGSFFQVHCFAQVITVIAHSTLKLIDNVLDKARDLIKFVNRSPSQRKKFLELAERKFQLQARRRLYLDRPLRWNSTYKLLDHVLYYKNVFMHLEEWDHNLLTEEEWQELSIVHKFLKMLYDVTCMILGTKFPSANLYLKGVLMIHCRMLEITRGSHTFLTDMIKEMQLKFDQYWSRNNLILVCAAILDPRYKVKFVEYCYMKLYGSSYVGEHVSKVVDALYCLFAEYKQHATLASSRLVGSSRADTNFSSGSEDGDVFGDYNQFLSVTSRSQRNKTELDIYLEEPSYDLNSDLDVLEFWSKSAKRYPELSAMACDVLSIPASTVTSKSAFNIGSKTLSQSSMMPETVQALICLQDWLCTQSDSGDPTIKGEDLGCSSEDAGDDDEYDDNSPTEWF
ncbi:hypothetical protein Nepgr_033387 [Nepenthes gracilis]|uniref:BED-type domain-containing protein n=1 Tax=Nepenthes gracilis TaxID=150966 RepID=A0AAD3Y6W0_NEPGR|nr:hypothetical protein Nepgr_033387 [Nepenthes gracilis]